MIVRWQDGTIWRNLQFIIQPEGWPLSISVIGHAWRDTDDRIFKSLDFGTVSCGDAAGLAASFPADLESAFAQSARIDLAHRASGDSFAGIGGW